MTTGTRRKPSQYNFLTQDFDELLLPTSGSLRRSTFPRGGVVKHIDIHHMTVQDSDDGEALDDCVAIWRKRQASAHYGVDNIFVAQFVYDNRMAWGNANGKANREGIIIEHANSTIGDKTGWKISETTLKTSAKLVAGLHITHKLGRPTSIGFGEGGTIRTHQSFFATSCPGPYFRSQWSRYIKMCQAAYDELRSAGSHTPIVVKPVPAPTPKPQEESVGHVKGVHWNIADDDTVNGYKATNNSRGDEIGRYVRDMKVDAFLACEAGDKGLIKGVSSILDNGWTKDDKTIWVPDKEILLAPRLTYNASAKYRYLKRGKYGAAMFGEKYGKRFGFLEIHTDFRKAADQEGQVLSIFEQFLADSVDLHVPKRNLIVAGDFNWDGSASDNPFTILKKYKFEEKGDRDAATFLDGRHLDGILGHKDAEVLVTRHPRSNPAGVKLSDHIPLEFRLSLS